MNKATLLIAILILSTTTTVPVLAGEAGAMQEAVSSLNGKWHGVLAYRDYQSERLVEIPHQRTVRSAPDRSYVLMELTFTDPGFRVFAAEVLTFDGDSVLAAYIENANVTTSRHQLSRFVSQDGGWTAELTGQGEDNNQPAAIKLVWHYADNTLTIEKLVQTDPQSPFEFRNRVRLERAALEP